MSDDRNKILQRVLNLRAIADDPAATEAEALAKLERAERLMHGYRITEAELAMAEACGRIKVEFASQAGKAYRNGYRGAKHPVTLCWHDIQSLTGTKAIFKGRAIEFNGHRSDVEYAIFLNDMIHEAMDRAYGSYKREARYVARGAKRSFQVGMALQLNRRMEELRVANLAEEKAMKLAEAARLGVDESEIDRMVAPEAMAELTSTALVLIANSREKAAVVEAAYRSRYPRIVKGRGSSTRTSDGTAFSAGKAAGNNVHLGRSIGSTGARALR